jgi:molybdopterin-guanine dinucleotide biosynthesis protein B
MPPIVAFIGWHNSGKTTVAAKALAVLRRRGLRVAAIKSSGKSGIVFDQAKTDTGIYKEAGTDGVLLVAPDQMVLQTSNDGASLPELAARFFPDHDLVIAEGFKQVEGVAKIEVRRPGGEILAHTVDSVVAVVTETGDAGHDVVFRPGQAKEIAGFIEEKFLPPGKRQAGNEQVASPRVSLSINGHPLPLKAWVQQALAGTVLGFVSALKKSQVASSGEGELVLRIRLPGWTIGRKP